jgi:RNA polymerase sigma-70 factor (ECF subfamily)
MTESKDLLPSEKFLLLVRRHRKAVFSLAYSKVRNVQDAEDITQEVFTEAYQNFVKLTDHSNVIAWLMKATGFRCKDHFRKMLRRHRRESSYLEMTRSSVDEKMAENPSDGLLDVVASLPEKFRVVLMLKHFAQLSYADISRMTGLSKTTIDGRLRTAKKKLKVKLEHRLRS